MFLRIPKVASSLLAVYFWNLHENDTTKLENVAGKHVGGLWVHNSLLRNKIVDSIRPLQNYSQEEIKLIIQQNEGVLVTRDPLDRIVSAWRDKFGENGVVASLQIKSTFFVRL